MARGLRARVSNRTPVDGAGGEPPVFDEVGSAELCATNWRAHLASGTRSVAVQVTAFVISLFVLIGILAAAGYDPSLILDALWQGSAGSSVSLGISLNQAVPLILTATAFWVAISSGIFNIGMDGQLQMGGVAALVTTFAFPAGVPPALVILVALVVGAIAGALWSGIAGVLKTKRGTNEIISTLMLTFIAFILVNELMRGPLQSETHRFTPQTDRIREDLHILFSLGGVTLSWGIMIAVVLSGVAIVAITKTNIGLRLRAVGLNREAARHAAVPIRRYWMASFLVTGALSGVAGALVILGLRFYIAPGWAPLWGFQGVVITFLALANPWLMPLWGILFGMLASAGPALKGTASVPDSIVTIMQTLPVIVLFTLYMAGRWVAGTALWPRAEVHGDEPPTGPGEPSDANTIRSRDEAERTESG